MNKKLLDILVCPFDKVTPLELFEFHVRSTNPVQTQEKKEIVNENGSMPNKNDKKKTEGQINISSPPINDPSDIVIEGILLCKTCTRYYPIMQEIPIILPDELRDKKKDIEFLTKWSKSIPQDLLKTLKPWTL